MINHHNQINILHNKMMFIKRFCKYLGISEKKFWKVAESYRNKNIWKKDRNEKFKLKVELK